MMCITLFAHDAVPLVLGQSMTNAIVASIQISYGQMGQFLVNDQFVSNISG